MLSPYRVRVTPEWVDYNHHLNEGAYGVIFSDATDHALIELGFGPAYREAIGGTFFTVETHTRFLREVPEAAEVTVTCEVLGVDEKRLHFWSVMRTSTDERPSATQETMLVHVDIVRAGVRPMGPEILANAQSLVRPTAPPEAGRSVRPLFLGTVP